MTKLDNTNFYIFDKSQEAALDGLLSDMDGAGPIVPTDCGPMVRITDEKDAKFLEQALA